MRCTIVVREPTVGRVFHINSRKRNRRQFMTLRTTKTQLVGVRWASRIALAVGILACGGSSEDSAFGTRDSALEDGASNGAANAASGAGAGNAAPTNTSSGVLGVATEADAEAEAGAEASDSDGASGSC